MDNAKIVKHCRTVESKLFAAFEKRRSHLLDIAREFYPVGIAGLERGVEELADGFVYDEEHRMLTTSPMTALREGAAGFHGNLTSPATRWFRLRLPGHMVQGGKLSQEQRTLLDHATEAAEGVFERSNAYGAMHRIYAHCLLAGFGCMVITADEERVCRCETLRLGTYALGVGEDGLVDTVVRRFAWTAAQIVRNFGSEAVPQYIRDGVGDPIRRYEVCNLIEPNAVGDERAHDKIAQEINMDERTIYRSIFWLKAATGETAGNGLLRVVGYSIRPIVAPRLDREEGDIYGRGRGDDALDLARGCQSFKFDELKIVQNQSEPAYLADAELKDEGLKLYRGAVNYVRFGEGRAAMAMPVNPNPPDPQGAREERMDAQMEISRLFYNDAFSIIDSVRRGRQSGQITATEVEQQVREAMQRLAPVATQFDREMLDPLVGIMTRYAVSSGRFPLTPEQAELLSEVKVEYVSAIHLAQKQSQISAIQQISEYAANMGNVRPELLMRVDWDRTLTTLADLVGFPQDCLLGDAEYAAAKQAAEQAAAKQAQVAELQAAAGAAKDIGGIPLDEGHGGSALASALAQGGIV